MYVYVSYELAVYWSYTCSTREAPTTTALTSPSKCKSCRPLAVCPLQSSLAAINKLRLTGGACKQAGPPNSFNIKSQIIDCLNLILSIII